METSKIDLEILEQQLRCPKGEKGKALGEQMDKSNISMTKSALELLPLSKEDKLLELGHGNAGHLPYIFDKAPGLYYTGLELSETMFEEARNKNKAFMALGKAEFILYDGDQLPFETDHFSKILTVNTIYFWESPIPFVNELARVCKAGGQLLISFADQSFMRNLPFVGEMFTLYDESAFMNLIEQSPFVVEKFEKRVEEVKSKSGEWVDRVFYNALLIKK